MVSVDWSRAPEGWTHGNVTIQGAANAVVTVKVDAWYPKEPTRDSLHGFAEANGYVAMESEHFTAKVDGVSARWERIDAPYNFTAKLRLADEYLKEERFDEALQLAGEVIKVDPTHATGQMILGEALVAKGDLPNGIVALETSRKLRPHTVRTHWDLLRAYTAAGRTDEAKVEKEEIERLRRPDAQQ